MQARIAVLIPCYNEEVAIAKVVAEFKSALPSAAVYVYDNNSTDRTRECAQAAGAIVRVERQPGKGNVVRRMFADVEADVYVLVDGDDTYQAAAAPRLINWLVDEHLDMVNAARESNIEEAYRLGHKFGNVVLTWIVAKIFGDVFKDMLSGYRVFSRRFVKSFPSLSAGFEIETELTVHALELRMPVCEAMVPYKDRPPGSISKLRTVRDGIRILGTIVTLVKGERPVAFFSSIAGSLAMLSVLLAIPVIITFIETGLVPRFPTAILCAALIVLSFLSLTCGLILDTVTRGRQEMKRMLYLSIPIRSTIANQPEDDTDWPSGNLQTAQADTRHRA